MLDAKSADDALRVLQEAEYGDREQSADEGAWGYERMLDEENDKIVRFITEISPEPGLLSVFLHKYDYHNLKVLLKAEFLNIEGGERQLPLSGAGMLDAAELSGIVRERRLSELSVEMAVGVSNAIEAYLASASVQLPDPQAIDICLDRAMYAQMAREAAELKNPFLIKLVEIYIDIANIGAFIRMREMRKEADFMRGVLLSGGRLDLSVFTRAANEGLEVFATVTQFTPYGQLIDEAVKALMASGQMTAFERLADDYINAYIKAARLYPAGLEVLVAYFVARQSELKNVRIVMAGKLNGIPADVIRERLRETYV
jgi:V/A-type H+-transporting ATPase subunit C